MQIRKNYWFVASAMVAAAGAVMMFSPRRAEAQYSSPVRVMNSSSAPAIGSLIDDPGRIPYLSQVTVLSNSCFANQDCVFSFPSVPAGHRLVVQQVSGYAALNSTLTPAALRVGVCYSPSLCETFQEPLIANNNFNVDQADFNKVFLGYIDAGNVPQVSWQAINTSFANTASSEVATLKGYLLDCSAAPCAPIAH